jgi:hypothetical protein
MEQEARRKGPRSPSEESDRRRGKKYDRSPSPRRRYRRSRSRSSSRERGSRRKENREHEWKANMQQPNKATNPTSAPNYPPPVMNQYNTAPPPNTSQPPPPLGYTQGYGNYNYNYSQSYPDYGGYQQATGYRNVCNSSARRPHGTASCATRGSATCTAPASTSSRAVTPRTTAVS